jgi:hypothetical protein
VISELIETLKQPSRSLQELLQSCQDAEALKLDRSTYGYSDTTSALSYNIYVTPG